MRPAFRRQLRKAGRLKDASHASRTTTAITAHKWDKVVRMLMRRRKIPGFALTDGPDGKSALAVVVDGGRIGSVLSRPVVSCEED